MALAAAVMLPRLATPEFGLLDDGLTIQTGREVSGRWSSVLELIPETGRFFPAYWLAYSLIVAGVGARPLPFFTVNLLLLAALLALLARLVRAAGGTTLDAAIAAAAFAVSGPAVEAFYTLSKAEPLQASWVGLSLLAAGGAASAACPAWRAGLGVLAAAASFVAHATKETTVVLVPVTLGWLLIERRWAESSTFWIRFAATALAINVVGVAGFLILRSQYAALPLWEGSYTRAYALASAGPALFRIVAWLARDFALLALVALAAPMCLRQRPALRRPLGYAGLWMAGWLAVYLPWPATFEYYLLPFTLGAATLAGFVVGDLWRRRRARSAQALIAATGVLWAAGVVNAVLDARVQLAVDRANSALVAFLGGLPPRSRVILNMWPPNEYHFELPMHLSELARRPDIVVGPPDPTRLVPAPAGETFVVTAEVANQPRPTVRIATDEAAVGTDHARLRGAIVPGQAELVYRVVERTPLLELGLHRLLCPLAVGPVADPTYCAAGLGLIDRRTFAYGWQVHRIRR